MFIYTHKQIKELIFDEFLHEIYLFYKLALSQTIAENLRSVSLWLTTSRNSLYHIICLLFKTELLWFLGCCFFFSYFLGELDICLNFVKVRKHRSKLMTRIKEHYIELTPHSQKNPQKQTNKKRTVGLLHFKTI